MAEGYWWCSNCHEEVHRFHVKHAELHEDCGHPVAWITPTVRPEQDLLRMFQVVEQLKKQISEIHDLALTTIARKNYATDGSPEHAVRLVCRDFSILETEVEQLKSAERQAFIDGGIAGKDYEAKDGLSFGQYLQREFDKFKERSVGVNL